MGKKAKINLINALISFFLCALIFLLVFFLYHTDYLIYERLSNAFLISGGIVVGLISLIWIGRMGTFDLLSYGFSTFINGLSPRKFEKKYKDFYDYKEQKEEKRKFNYIRYWPYLSFGGTLLALAIVFAIVAANVI